MVEDIFKDIDKSLETFNTYFPHEREDVDIIVLRGHQLAENLLYKFVRSNVPTPQHIDSFFISWKPLLSLVRALKTDDEAEYNWVWNSLIKLAKTRNLIAHNLTPEDQAKHITDFINCVRSQVPPFKDIPGDNELKKSIFVVYCGLSTALALENFPSCTATYIAREKIQEHGQSILEQGTNND